MNVTIDQPKLRPAPTLAPTLAPTPTERASAKLSSALHTPREEPTAHSAAHAGGSGVRLYGEADLVSLNVPHQGVVSHLVRDLLAAGSPRQRERLVRDRLDEIGFEWMGYYSVRPSAGGNLHRSYLVTYSPSDWVKLYFDEHYDDIDPRLASSACSSLPLLWDLDSIDEIIAARPPSTKSRHFVKDLHDSGLCSGISFQVPRFGAAPGERSVVSFASSVASRRWMDDRVLGDALLFGLSLHDYMAQHVRLPEAETMVDDCVCGASPNSLPAMQQAVLSHVVRGLTDRQIAERLKVSAHAVDYHLRQLRQRFAVRNRVQLVNAAAGFAATTL